jgi:hypothetical protein
MLHADVLVRGSLPAGSAADNGSILQDWIDALPEEPLQSKAGRYWMHTGVDFGTRNGLKFDLGAAMKWTPVNGTWHTETSAAVLIYDGPSEDPAFRIGNGHPSFEGLNLWRSCHGEGLPNQADSVAVEFLDPCTSPRFRDCSFAGWETALKIKSSNHSECITLHDVQFYGCQTCIRNEEQQAVAHHFTNLMCHNLCEVFFDCVDLNPAGAGAGLGFVCNVITFLGPVLVLRVEHGSSNGQTVRFTGVKFDNQAVGWKLLEHLDGPLSLFVRGEIGNMSTPHKDAIVATEEAKLDIRLDWNGLVWPEDFRWDNTTEAWVERDVPSTPSEVTTTSVVRNLIR